MSDDFAATAMMRLIAHGLAREGLALRIEATDARVPLADKRALLQALMAAHGPERLLRIGQHAIDAPEEPTASALLAASDPPDLIARWQRLERYVHSRHRVQVLAQAPGRLQLAHVSLAAGEPPWPAEDLLVWGLLIGLLQRLGTAGLAHSIHLAATAELVLHRQPPPAPASAPQHAGEPGMQPLSAPALLAAAEQALAADPAAPWSLARLAQHLGTTPRTLQRRLAAQGRSFSQLWMAARLHTAAQLLLRAPASTAEIGYRSGFADQAHFTRSFRRHTALTPARYRAEFGVSA